MTTPEEFRSLLDSPEGSRVEFKAASGGFHFDELVKYCVALANEGGGSIVLGVTGGRNCTLFCTRVQCRCNCWQLDHPSSAAELAPVSPFRLSCWSGCRIDEKQSLHYVRHAFRREPDFGVTSVNYDLADLLVRSEEHR